jgi:hypothetical protein
MIGFKDKDILKRHPLKLKRDKFNIKEIKPLTQNELGFLMYSYDSFHKDNSARAKIFHKQFNAWRIYYF